MDFQEKLIIRSGIVICCLLLLVGSWFVANELRQWIWGRDLPPEVEYAQVRPKEAGRAIASLAEPKKVESALPLAEEAPLKEEEEDWRYAKGKETEETEFYYNSHEGGRRLGSRGWEERDRSPAEVRDEKSAGGSGSAASVFGGWMANLGAADRGRGAGSAGEGAGATGTDPGEFQYPQAFALSGGGNSTMTSGGYQVTVSASVTDGEPTNTTGSGFKVWLSENSVNAP